MTLFVPTSIIARMGAINVLIAAAVFIIIFYLANQLISALTQFINDPTVRLIVTNILALISAGTATLFIIKRLNSKPNE